MVKPTQKPKSTHTEGEFELIGRFADVLGTDLPPEIVVGIGDDCAVARRGDDFDVYTTDTMVDGVHFRRGQIPWFDLGWKSVAVNLSDIAAMGARPLHCLVTVGVPGHVASDDLAEVYRGMAAVTAEHGGTVVGGDVVRASELFITVSAIGTLSGASGGGGGDGGKDSLPLLLRSGARPGDVVAVTGDVGSAAGGLKALGEGLAGGREALVDRLHRPTPRVAAGKALVAAGVRCAIDISDGLVSDLGHICDASAVSAVVRLPDIPVSPLLKEIYPDEWVELSLSGGEDYELLFVASAELIEGLRDAVDVPVTVIGRISESTDAPDVSFLSEDGRPVHIDASGWDHLKQ